MELWFVLLIAVSLGLLVVSIVTIPFINDENDELRREKERIIRIIDEELEKRRISFHDDFRGIIENKKPNEVKARVKPVCKWCGEPATHMEYRTSGNVVSRNPECDECSALNTTYLRIKHDK